MIRTARRALSRRTCEQRLDSLIRDWRAELGLDEWQYEYEFASLDDEGSLATLADCDIDIHNHMVGFRFNHLLRPDLYEGRVVHEWLHVRWRPVERAIRQLTEPAQTVVYDAHHAALIRTARVLVGEPRPWLWGRDMLLARPPWESARA